MLKMCANHSHVEFSAEYELQLQLKQGHIDVFDVETVAKKLRKKKRPHDPVDGVLFITYRKLQNTEHLRTLIKDWCGGQSFDGPLIFDESHNGKNEATEVHVAISVSSDPSLPSVHVVIMLMVRVQPWLDMYRSLPLMPFQNRSVLPKRFS